MKFEKGGKVYANMVVAVYDYCNGLKYCYGCKLYGKTGDCLAYAQLHPKEVARLLGYEMIEDKPDTEKGVIMNNERKMSILLNTIEQMACDAEDKGEIDFGLRLTVEDAYALCRAASHTDNTPDIREVVEKYGEDVKRKLTRVDILHAAEKCVCGQREQDYSTPEDNFKAIAELWEAYLNKACTRGVNVRVEAKDVAAMMALLKIARIAAGGGKADSWIDLAGYAACGAECEGVTE